MQQTVVGAPAAVGSAARRVMLHLLLPLALGYLLLLLDRASVALHAREIGTALGLTPFQVGLTTPIMFLGVLLFEVPSALAAGRTGPQRWLTAMLVVWGGADAATAFASGPGTFFAARIVASVAQAGYLPVAIFTLARFTPASYRTRMFAWLVLVGLAAAVGAQPIANELRALEGALGHSAWRLGSLLLGLLCLLLAAVVTWRLPDTPEQARWLRPAEADALAWSRSVEPRQRRSESALSALLDPRLLILAAISFALALSSFAAGTWYAALMQDRRAPVRVVEVVFVAAILVTALLWSRAVDRNGRLFPGLVIALGLATVAYAAGVFRGPVVAKLIGLVAHAATLAAARAMVWSIASRLAIAGGGAAALAVIDATGLVASFVAPRLVAGLAQQAQSMQVGLLAIILVLLAATGLAALLRSLWQRD